MRPQIAIPIVIIISVALASHAFFRAWGFLQFAALVQGFRTRNANLLTLSAELERRVEIDWQESQGETFVVRLGVTGEDRRGLYADICEAVSQTGTNIRNADLSSRDAVVYGSLLVEVENHTHLNKVLRAVRRVKGVTGITRRDSGAHEESTPG